MSGILDYVKGLFPTLEKNRILEDVASLEKENAVIKDAYSKLTSENLGLPSNNYFISMLNSRAKGLSNSSRAPNTPKDFLDQVRLASENLETILPWVKEQVGKSFAGTNVKEALSYRQAVILQYVDGVSFFERYAGALGLVVSKIAASSNPEQAKIENLIIRAEAQFLTSTMDFFFVVLGYLLKPVKEYQALVMGVPDIVADDSTDQVIATQAGFTKIDPLRLNFALHNLNPGYYRKRRNALLLVKRYEAAKEDAVGIELHLEKLRARKQGEEDTSLDVAIKYHEDRLIKLRKEIERIEEEYGD